MTGVKAAVSRKETHGEGVQVPGKCRSVNKLDFKGFLQEGLVIGWCRPLRGSRNEPPLEPSQPHWPAWSSV